MSASKKRSKKPSGSNYTEKKQHEPLTLFLDRALGKRFIVKALSRRNPEITVKLLDDHFEANVPDEEWLRFAGQKGWIAITKDKRIRYRTPALDVIKKDKVKLFIFTRGNLTGQEMAEILTKAIPRIKRFLAKLESPFIVTMTKSDELSKVKFILNSAHSWLLVGTVPFDRICLQIFKKWRRFESEVEVTNIKD